MNQRTKNALEVLTLTLIAAFGGAIALGIFVDLFWAADSRPSEAFRGAFLGAFFAFLFVRLSAALTTIFERREKGRNALIVIQHHLREVINNLHDNIYVMDKLADYEKALRGGQPTIFMNTFSSVPPMNTLIIPLMNLDLINELAEFDVDIRKLNDSTRTWERSNEKLLDSFISKQLDQASFVVNALASCEEAKVLGRFFVALKEDAITHLSTVRILAKRDQTLIGKAMSLFGQKHYEKYFSRQRAEERARLVSEAATINAQGLNNGLTATQRLRRTLQGDTEHK
jgi:hypothetical protein